MKRYSSGSLSMQDKVNAKVTWETTVALWAVNRLYCVKHQHVSLIVQLEINPLFQEKAR
jgi:hypothetical protein